MKKVLCNNTELPRVFAHVLDDGTIDIVRQDQRFTIIGESFTLIGTNPQGDGKTVLQVVGGKLLEEDIKFKEEDNAEPRKTGEEKGNVAEPSGDNGQERQKEDDNAGSPDNGNPAPDPAPVAGKTTERTHTVKG